MRHLILCKYASTYQVMARRALVAGDFVLAAHCRTLVQRAVVRLLK